VEDIMPQLTQRHLFLRTSVLVGFALVLVTTNANAGDTASVEDSMTAASQPTTELISKFTSFAGSTTNAESLVNGLRNGSPVALQSTTPMTPGVTFTSPTKPMGFGNVNIALSLARSDLASQGITQPTPSQIETALLGGPLTTANGSTTLPGILTLRSRGEGWGEIAHALGIKVGDVVRSERAQRVDKDGNFAQHKPERPEKPEKVERVSRVDRPERPQRPERPERVDRPDRQARR
jgi:hypothetical protein